MRTTVLNKCSIYRSTLFSGMKINKSRKSRLVYKRRALAETKKSTARPSETEMTETNETDDLIA